MANLVPYSASSLPASPTRALGTGLYQGVYLTCLAENLDQLREAIERWYEQRDDVIMVDHGITEKAGHGYVVIEWEECEADQLLLDMLRSEEAFLDFAVYVRDSGV